MKFTATHITILVSITLICVFGYVGWNDWVLNQPVIVPIEEVEQIVEEIFKRDSVINKPINIQYTYKDSKFEDNGDTTYWYCDIMEKSNDMTVTSYDVYKMPHSHFDFVKIFEGEMKFNRKNDYYIKYLTQISEATYTSYGNFRNKIN